MRDSVAVYVHVPFCHKKCGYCDFSSFATNGPIVDRTVDAIVRQVHGSPFAGRPAKTVFFGGGTPNFLSSAQLARILSAVLCCHPPQGDIEITAEANPGASNAFAELREAGFNRLSLGVQSFLDADLQRLGRIHTAKEAREAVSLARRAGFDNLSLDLMYGLPGQNLQGWRRNLEECAELAPEHLSLYCLTIEEGTPFALLERQGRLDLPDEDAQIAMDELSDVLLEGAGLERYEISNFAKPGRECLHNLCYWRGEDYLAYGPGGVGCVDAIFFTEASPESVKVRYSNLKNPNDFCTSVEAGETGWIVTEELDESTLRVERVMLGLRLREGVPEQVCPEQRIDKLVRKGWGLRDGGRVSLTPLGRRFCNDAAFELAFP